MTQKKVITYLFSIAFSLIAQAQIYIMEGKIGNYPASIVVNESQVVIDSIIHCKYLGNYYYHNPNIPIIVENEGYYTDNSLIFNAYPTEKNREISHEIFTGIIQDSLYIGTWKKKDKELPFSFQVKQIPFQTYILKDSVVYQDIKHRNVAEYNTKLILSNNAKVQDYFIDKIFNKDPRIDIQEILTQAYNQYARLYKKEVGETYKNQGDGINLDYIHNTSLQPITFTQKYIVYQFYHYEYLGGAHGNYTFNYYNYSIEKDKILTGLEIFKPKQNQAVAKIIDSYVRKEYKIPTHIKDLQDFESDEIYFLVDKIPFTDNCIISQEGITFVYQTYEVTPYVYGNLEVFVPFEALKPFLEIQLP